MEYVRLGNSGLKVSRLILGCMTFGDPNWTHAWVLNEESSRDIIKDALDRGVTTFDTADMYSLGVSEEIVGRALRDWAPRHSVVIATKLYHPMSSAPNDRGLSRKHILDAVDSSLKRLGTDYIDLYQIHRFDYETPLEETLCALNDVVRAGKVRYLGASSMHAWQFMKTLGIQRANGWAPFISMQNHYNLLYREEEREMLPLCRSEGIGVIPYSPLARGLLVRLPSNEKTLRERSDERAAAHYNSDQDRAIINAVHQVAERLGKPMMHVAYAWLASRNGVTAPIVGISKSGQLDAAIAALDVSLEDCDVAALEALYRPKPVVGYQ